MNWRMYILSTSQPIYSYVYNHEYPSSYSDCRRGAAPVTICSDKHCAIHRIHHMPVFVGLKELQTMLHIIPRHALQEPIEVLDCLSFIRSTKAI